MYAKHRDLATATSQPLATLCRETEMRTTTADRITHSKDELKNLIYSSTLSPRDCISVLHGAIPREYRPCPSNSFQHSRTTEMAPSVALR